MATKTFETKSGKTVTVEFERRVQDKIANLDGQKFVTGREIVERTKITLRDGAKIIAQGNEVGMLHPGVPTNAAMIAKGAVARLGDAYLPQAVVDQINAVLAELDAENPKSDEQLQIEAAKAANVVRYEADEPWRRQREEFARKMEREDSDL